MQLHRCAPTHIKYAYTCMKHTHTIEKVKQRLESELRLPTDTEDKKANLSPIPSPATAFIGKACKVAHDGLWSSLMHAGGSLKHSYCREEAGDRSTSEWQRKV